MSAPIARRRRRWPVLVAVAGAVLLLAAGSTFAVAAASGGLGATALPAAARASCVPASLPGAQVTVRLLDAGHMRGGAGPMMGGSGPMMGGRTPFQQGTPWRFQGRGMMALDAAPATVSAGTVSFSVVNGGGLTHEMVILPLPQGQQVGARSVQADGTVDETGSLGEASATCRAGAGDGIAAGSAGWISLHLAPGRYELICNLPGHYAAGMFAELDVT